MTTKKLIEVAMPLDDINAACSREKSIRHGHPSTLHLWWARRPLAAARAVTFASLVDDPSSHPEEFPTEEAQSNERERLFRIIRELIIWENSNDQTILGRAHAEIMKSTHNNPPAFLDPFAGGGALPLEAQRLGLKVYACDLNPVAVMINKAMVEIPSKYQNLPPVHPDALTPDGKKARCMGMANDVEYYGKLLKEKAFEKIGHLYPEVEYIDGRTGQKSTVIAWIWARTLKCTNPACGCEIPLVHSFDLSTKKGKEKHIELVIHEDKHIEYHVEDGLAEKVKGTVSRSGGAVCPVCGQPIGFDELRRYGRETGFGAKLIAIVAEEESRRLYLSPNSFQEKIAMVQMPIDIPAESMPEKALGFRSQHYGMTKWAQLFTNRQLTLLTTLIDCLDEVEAEVEKDVKTRNNPMYMDYPAAIRTYLAFLIDKMTDYHSSFCSWNSAGQKMRNVFGRQAIPMVWDYAEANPFCSSSGCFDNMLEWVVKSVRTFPASSTLGIVKQWDATQDFGLRDIMVSTDPPYYDNIGYADLSDFFYVWMRKSLKNTYPDLFTTMLTPKITELIATPFRFDGSKAKAKEFFENGMEQTCKNLFAYARPDIPVTIYYAFKQSETDSDDEKASSGWETMLAAIINAGFIITGTWPMNTELGNRMVADESNALASSIIIVCRKAEKLGSVSLREFTGQLKKETAPALEKLRDASIAPVDLAQSSIGPGIAVYSRYKSILKSDGLALGVREALKIINKELDSHLNEAIGFADTGTRFCLALYQQRAFNYCSFGEADTLARSKNISVDDLARIGAVESRKGKVCLSVRENLPEFKITTDSKICYWLCTQQVVHAYETEGLKGVGKIFAQLGTDVIENIKTLCYQLFSIADSKGWAQEALAYNTLISSWDATVRASESIKNDNKDIQPGLDF